MTIERLQCHKGGITGVGDPSKRIFFVGTSPAKYETMPFTGRPGQVLENILQTIGLSKSDVFLTNLQCYYSDNPTMSSIGPCAKRLEEEIELHRPKVIVAFGELATEYFAKKPLKKCRGAVLYNSLYGAYIICTYQPASVFYGTGATVHDLVRDITKIPEVLTWPEDGSIASINYEVIQSSQRAQQILDNLPDGNVAIDIETTNKDVEEIDAFVDKLICLCVATKERAYVFPEAICKGLNWPTHPRYTFQNGMFDVGGMIRYLGVRLHISDDTMLMSYALDERKGRHSLKTLAREYCGAGWYEEEAKVGRNLKDKHDLAKLYEYNAKDGVYTARLAGLLHPKLYSDNVQNVYSNLLVPAADAFAEIQARGAHVDLGKIRDLALKWFPQWLEGEKDLIADAKDAGFPGEINLNSSQQLGTLLFEILKLPGAVYTEKTGKPSTKKEVLEKLEDYHPYVSKLLAWRRLDHVVTSYVIGIRDDVKIDSRVHAQVKLHGTHTGRLSYTKPPLQTIPKPRSDEDQDFLELREMFTATNKDYCIVETDYEKAEVWGAYAVSQDPHLLEDLHSPDFHRTVASNVYKVPFEEVTERQRFNSKRVTFGIIYGIQDYTLSKLISSTPAEAATIRYNWYSRYSKYFEWYEKTREELFREGEIVGPTGRKRRFKIFIGDYHDAVNKAVNFPIQSLASDVTLASTIKLHSLLKEFDSYILWCVHDAIIFEVKKKYLEPALKLIKNTMSAVHFDGIPGIPVEIKVGDRLSNTEKVKV